MRLRVACLSILLPLLCCESVYYMIEAFDCLLSVASFPFVYPHCLHTLCVCTQVQRDMSNEAMKTAAILSTTSVGSSCVPLVYRLANIMFSLLHFCCSEDR